MRTSRSFLLVSTIATAFIISTPTDIQADPILVASATPGGGAGNNPIAVSWTQTDTWTDVDVSLTFLNQCAEFLHFFCEGNSFTTGDVYLTNAIGAGTTAAANELAHAIISTSGVVFPTLTAFSDLTLGPGTYYLLFEQENSLGAMFWALPSVGYAVLAGTGVTQGSTYFGFGDSSSGYPPATGDPFLAIPSNLLFSITGTRVEDTPTPIPEPTSLLLVGTGLGIAARIRARRSRKS